MRFHASRAAALLALTVACGSAEAADTTLSKRPPPEGVQVSIVSPKDGDSLGSDVRVVVTTNGIAPAGQYYVLVDQSEWPMLDEPMPVDEFHQLIPSGKTETTLRLPPGTHTLQVDVVNGARLQYDPPLVSEMITITTH
jgi:hypothetical protein